MRRLHYAGGVMLVGDATCKAVLRYARALADVGESDVVQIPVVTEGGSRAHAHLLLGPASQLSSTPVENSQGEDPLDEGVVARIELEARRMQPARPSWSDEMTDNPDVDFLDFTDVLGQSTDSASPGT
ncbi:hypothetical protein [Rathayibacter sp. VKM Ac-2630]|uniref:hypothetical protein n=1 Tax=Rathayibacter sp. VKM Ac-2630 TaxID=1938617 RepID=UPI00098189AE|nr:hypothetical protein [Rathayibacter sp. VKM Ac-2630]OOB90099.1 hypothetical protein B0T42_13760 [Rathayibacter sp. VKM Ac-2630]